MPVPTKRPMDLSGGVFSQVPLVSSMRLPFTMNTTKKLSVLGAFVVFVCVLVSFYPVTRLGFFNDDWWLIADAGKMDLVHYLRFYFDPFTQTIWYRPLHGILMLIEYTFWGSNAEGYHWIQNLVHLANSLLLFAVVYQVSRRWRVAFVSALLYAVFFPGSIAVFQITVHDPLAWLFYLLTVLLWCKYLATNKSSLYWLAMGSFILALMGKETSVALIVTMFLLDVLIVSKKISLGDLLRRYPSFCLILLGYLAIEYRIQTQGHFTNQAGYSFGVHSIENLWRYFTLLVLPGGWSGPAVFIGLLMALIGLAGILIRKWRTTLDVRVIVFLTIQFILSVAPVLGLPTDLFEQRYLYAASAVAAVAIALLFEWAWTRMPQSPVALLAFSLSLVILVAWHSISTTTAALAQEETNREQRVPFRDIVQRHPTYPPDTYLYFINSPYILNHFAPSMFFFKYDQKVTIGDVAPEWWGTVSEPEFANLHAHSNSYIYYYDDFAQRHEIPVEPVTNISTSFALPVSFLNGIQLAGYEISHAQLNRNDTLVVLLYWRAKAQIDRDYTVFVHLVDKDGHQIAGDDSQPRNGLMPTTTWKPGNLVVDPHILQLSGASIGQDYHLEIGLYYLPTMERVNMITDAGETITDTLTIAPFSVVK